MRRFLIAGVLLGVVVVAFAACSDPGSDAETDALQLKADTYEIGRIEEQFHQAMTLKDIDQMMSLWAPNATLTIGPDLTAAGVWRTLREVLADFLGKPGIWLMILFIVMFRFAEGQVQTIGPLFLIEARDKGGLGLSTEQVGGIYGTVGTAAFLLGSIVGGYFTSWMSLRRAMPFLIVAMAVPNATFYYLAVTMPADLWHVGFAVAVEMLGYGFGFVGMILFIMQAVAPGKYQTAHYALGSGVMQLGFIFAKFISGDIQVSVGYQHFFAWTIACGVLPLLLLLWVPMPRAAQRAEAVPA